MPMEFSRWSWFGRLNLLESFCPERLDRIALNGLVGRHDRQVVLNCLTDEQTVEWINMKCWEFR